MLRSFYKADRNHMTYSGKYTKRTQKWQLEMNNFIVAVGRNTVGTHRETM